MVTVFLGLVKEEVPEGTFGGATGFRVWFSLRRVVNPVSEWHGFQSGGLFREVLLGLWGSRFGGPGMWGQLFGPAVPPYVNSAMVSKCQVSSKWKRWCGVGAVTRPPSLRVRTVPPPPPLAVTFS